MISDTELLAYIRPSTEDDIDLLRRLERAAVAYIQTRTGRYFGVGGTVTETLSWRGWPMALANEPSGGTITSLQSWDGSAWVTVDAASYHYASGFIFWNTSTSWSPLTMPTQYRVVYTAGFTVQGADEWAAPEDIRQAVLLLVGTWYENRESVVVGESQSELPLAVSALIDGHIRVAV